MNFTDLKNQVEALPKDIQLLILKETVANLYREAQDEGRITSRDITIFLSALYRKHKPADEQRHRENPEAIARFSGSRRAGMSEALLDVPGTETEETITAAIECVRREGVGRAAVIQRRFQFGYSRAVHVLNELERRNIVTKPEDSHSHEWPLVEQKRICALCPCIAMDDSELCAECKREWDNA